MFEEFNKFSKEAEEKMAKLKEELTEDCMKSKESREVTAQAVKGLLHDVISTCDENLNKISKDLQPYYKVKAFNFVQLFAEVGSNVETVLGVFDTLVDVYEKKIEQSEEEARKREKDIFGGYAQHPKCFGNYYENCKQCNYVLCPVRTGCREECCKHNE